jgi:hypothetical protein
MTAAKTDKDLVLALGADITSVHSLVHALYLACDGLAQEEDRDALQQLCETIAGKLHAVDQLLTELDDSITARTKTAWSNHEPESQ